MFDPYTVAQETQIRELLNAAADEVIAAADLPDTGTQDAINLVVNAALHYLFVNPSAPLNEVVEQSYGESYETVIGWIS